VKGVLLTNGRRAVAYRVEHLLDRDDLINLLASTQRNRSTGDPLPRLSSREVQEQVRDLLARNGSEASHYWTDDLSDRSIALVTAWAEEHVDRVYGRALAPPQ
jgi:hypothetical protein